MEELKKAHCVIAVKRRDYDQSYFPEPMSTSTPYPSEPSSFSSPPPNTYSPPYRPRFQRPQEPSSYPPSTSAMPDSFAFPPPRTRYETSNRPGRPENTPRPQVYQPIWQPEAITVDCCRILLIFFSCLVAWKLVSPSL